MSNKEKIILIILGAMVFLGLYFIFTYSPPEEETALQEIADAQFFYWKDNKVYCPDISKLNEIYGPWNLDVFDSVRAKADSLKFLILGIKTLHGKKGFEIWKMDQDQHLNVSQVEFLIDM